MEPSIKQNELSHGQQNTTASPTVVKTSRGDLFSVSRRYATTAVRKRPMQPGRTYSPAATKNSMPMMKLQKRVRLSCHWLIDHKSGHTMRGSTSCGLIVS